MNESLNQRWYQGITRYQWLVLFIASAGWAFDVFEGQIFVASMREAMPSLLEKMAATEVEGTGEKSPEYDADHPLVKQWNDWGFGSFLLGGALGGVLFGVLSDRIGRSKTMVITILFYSLFTCVTAFAQSPSQMVGLRFLVAMGVGGEWAVASAMVAEVMPGRTRPVTSSIFHASSVFGTLLATGVGATIVGNEALGWRWGFAIGVTPALLILIIRWKLKDPPQWIKARERAKEDSNQQTGRLVELFQRDHLRNTIVGVSLASIGLVTFWGGHIYGKNALLRYEQDKVLTASGISPPKHDPPPEDATETKEDNKTARKKYEDEYQGALTKYKDDKKAEFKKHPEIKRAEMLSMALNTIGGGLGLLFFGTISTRLGRKKTFILYHAIAFLLMVFLFQGLIANNASALALSLTLPVFGFFTLGMHAGYAVYFPELYPTRLRSTGAGFCFNIGRLATAAAFFGFGYVTITQENKALLLAPLYLVGVVIVFFARETRGKELPD